ncbi:MAG: SDR family NAD(P)-dependent oxidoreductase [Proteobacteria bacterium]|nr:SDR family NAD(P)-dependent oxidoreductase [Pseudomonadota bacterium]
MDTQKIALVVGVGDGLGSAVARKFAGEGLTVCAARRNGEKLNDLCRQIGESGGIAHGFSLDARKEEQVVDLFDKIEREIGPIEVAVFNVGGNVRFGILETTVRKYTKMWEMGCLAGFITGREAARKMVPRGRGTIIFTGATASVRGAAGYAAFAGAKHGLKALSQSMARELGSKGIHVAHVVVDGAIDTPWIRENFSEWIKGKPDHALLNPDDIAENYLMLYKQPLNAWTHEIDLRPSIESW